VYVSPTFIVSGNPLTRVNVVTGSGAAAESNPVIKTINTIKPVNRNVLLNITSLLYD
jgi:hypothetical protein